MDQEWLMEEVEAVATVYLEAKGFDENGRDKFDPTQDEFEREDITLMGLVW
ncbi:MAG TPA: hypothetical protein P5056_01670 [Candidatus Paceibacterota bacterium]|nr:hypothetical protein [Candidatus Paceibacterota bacterium]